LLIYVGGMARDTFIKVRVSEEERQKYLDAASWRDKPLGVVIRESLDRLVRRVEKERTHE
jgi:hypothetical protein